MQKYIAFDLFTKNELGGHTQAFDLSKRKDGVQVCLVADVEPLVFSIPAYLLDPNDSHYCEPLAKAYQDLMVTGAGE